MTISASRLLSGLVLVVSIALAGCGGSRQPKPASPEATGALADVLDELRASADCFGTSTMGESYAGGGDAEVSVWQTLHHNCVSGNRAEAEKWIEIAKANCPAQAAKLDELLPLVTRPEPASE